jgi:hypothetical protein
VRWSKEAAAADKEWLSSQQQQQQQSRGSLDPVDSVEELQRLSQSLQRWTRHARAFPVLISELVAHVRQCAAAVAAADHLRATATNSATGSGLSRLGSGPGGSSGGGGGGGGGGEKPWTKEEKTLLKTAMGKYPKGHPQRWEMVAKVGLCTS